ncbi:MAG: S9 family peptidase [Bacteroidales bacterium]|nr:S9 family peptidase [Bacteroidales bacterium]
MKNPDRIKRTMLAAAMLLCALQGLNAQEINYKTPPKDVMEMILAAPIPKAVFNRQMDMAAIYGSSEPYVKIAEMAAINEFKVAGLRLNADNFSQTRKTTFNKLEILNVSTGEKKAVTGMPVNAKIHDFKWSPDGKTLCFLNDTKNEVELYKVDAMAGNPSAVKINANRVNSIFGSPFAFLDDNTIIYRSVPQDLGKFPEQGNPKGPIVQESINRRGSYRTYQDLLKSPYDEAVFQYLCTSVFSVYDGNETKTIGEKGIIKSYDISPDGKYMMVSTTHKPYSYSSTYNSFPSKNEIWSTADGSVVKVLRDLPKKPGKEEAKPADKDKKEPKAPAKPSKGAYSWRTDKGAVLTWTETLPAEDGKEEMRGPDGMPFPSDRPFPGDEEREEDKDKPERTWYTAVYQCEAPFDVDNDKKLVITSEYRIGRVIWGNDKVALYTDNSSKQKLTRTFVFNPSDTTVRRLLRSEDTSLDTLGNRPVYGSVCTERGTGKLKLDPKNAYILYTGESRLDENNDGMSFIDRMSLKDGKTENVWMGKAPYKELISGIRKFDAKSVDFITTRESGTEVPNYMAVSVKNKKLTETPITDFKNTIPHYDRIRSEYITYKRADGVNCAARVFLPADYDKERDGKLPVFMWTYPYEHRTVVSAERRHKADRYGFVVPNRNKQVFWCLNGYAVVLEWSMPIISEKNGGQPNEVFRKNLVMNAEAIIKALDEAGIGDPDRMAVGGHSYGGFMTGNLLAHTRLYKLGVANSGAYNRTLTPYGFQSENRDYWKIPKIYNEMSPYNYADKVKDAILLTHGQMDDNTGTHPIQSERFYYAIAGHNGKARWLQLPYEGHGYLFKENLLHYFYEVGSMLDKYVKNAKPKPEKPEGKPGKPEPKPTDE